MVHAVTVSTEPVCVSCGDKETETGALLNWDLVIVDAIGVQ